MARRPCFPLRFPTSPEDGRLLPAASRAYVPWSRRWSERRERRERLIALPAHERTPGAVLSPLLFNFPFYGRETQTWRYISTVWFFAVMVPLESFVPQRPTFFFAFPPRMKVLFIHSMVLLYFFPLSFPFFWRESGDTEVGIVIFRTSIRFVILIAAPVLSGLVARRTKN